MTAQSKSGRPRSFDRSAALKQAMLLFWRNGYEATSLNDLIGAMGISPPSLYAAFGDKKRLFLEAVELYTSGGPVTFEESLEAADTAHEAVCNLLQGAAIVFTGPDTPPGCLLVSAATNCTAASSDVQAALAEIRRRNQDLLRARIRRDIDHGMIPPEPTAEDLAAFFMTIVQGMSTQARDGAARAKLLAIAGTAMRAWPQHEKVI